MSGGGRQGAGPVDLSPGVTTVAFDPIIPPLRIPVPAGEDDDPTKGEWVLAFADEDSWRRGWQKCHAKISEQCEMGARMGCSLSATNVCRIPWWKQVLVFMKAAKIEEGEREACEEREMMACLAGAKETCTKYARDTCDPVFADARIAEPHVPVNPRFTGPPRRRRLTRNMRKENEHAFDEKNPEALLADRYHVGSSNRDSESSEKNSKMPTNYRGRTLMSEESIHGSWDGPVWSQRAEEGETPGATDAPIDGWEGGLIRPKFKRQTVQPGDQKLSDVRPQSIWQGIEQRVRSVFQNVRI